MGSRRRRSANHLRHRGRARYRSSGTTDPRNLQVTSRRGRQDVLASTSSGHSGSGTRDSCPPLATADKRAPGLHRGALGRLGRNRRGIPRYSSFTSSARRSTRSRGLEEALVIDQLLRGALQLREILEPPALPVPPKRRPGLRARLQRPDPLPLVGAHGLPPRGRRVALVPVTSARGRAQQRIAASWWERSPQRRSPNGSGMRQALLQLARLV